MFITSAANYILYAILSIIPILVIVLIIYVIISLLRHNQKGKLDYKNNPLNILENNTTESTEENSDEETK